MSSHLVELHVVQPAVRGSSYIASRRGARRPAPTGSRGGSPAPRRPGDIPGDADDDAVPEEDCFGLGAVAARTALGNRSPWPVEPEVVHLFERGLAVAAVVLVRRERRPLARALNVSPTIRRCRPRCRRRRRVPRVSIRSGRVGGRRCRPEPRASARVLGKLGERAADSRRERELHPCPPTTSNPMPGGRWTADARPTEDIGARRGGAVPFEVAVQQDETDSSSGRCRRSSAARRRRAVGVRARHVRREYAASVTTRSPDSHCSGRSEIRRGPRTRARRTARSPARGRRAQPVRGASGRARARGSARTTRGNAGARRRGPWRKCPSPRRPSARAELAAGPARFVAVADRDIRFARADGSSACAVRASIVCSIRSLSRRTGSGSACGHRLEERFAEPLTLERGEQQILVFGHVRTPIACGLVGRRQRMTEQLRRVLVADPRDLVGGQSAEHVARRPSACRATCRRRADSRTRT